MPPRRIVDTTGVTWDLWEVDPSTAATPVPSSHPADGALLPRLPGTMHSGWIAARNGVERRRIAPVPSDWMFMTDGQLRQLVERARDVPVADDRRRPTDAVLGATPGVATPRTLVRTFEDAAGVRWDAWEAHPALRDRRAARDRRTAPRDSPDRRHAQAPGFGHGWIVFRNGQVRHRLHAVPPGWHQLADIDLCVLLARAARPSGAQSWSD